MTHVTDAVGACGVPASSLQEQWWFLDHWATDHTANVVALPLRLRGELHADRLRDAFDDVLARHDVLRSRFELRDGALYVHLVPPAPGALVVSTATGDPESLVGQDIGAVSAGSSCTAVLHRLGHGDHLLVLVAHRAVADARSLEVVAEELAARYRGETLSDPVAPLDGHRADIEALTEYWRGKLDGVPTLDMPADHVRPATMSFRGDWVTRELSTEVSAALRGSGADLRPQLLAAVALVLSRHTAANRFVLGVGHPGRPVGGERLVGPYADTVAAVLDVDGLATAAEVVEHCGHALADAVAHAGMSVAQLVERLDLPRDPSRHPVFQYAVETAVTPRGFAMADLDVEVLDTTAADQRLDLRFRFVDHQGSAVQLRLGYATDLFDRRRVEHLAEHVTTLLTELLAEPLRRPGELAMLGVDELRGLDTEWQGHLRPVDAAMMHERFARQARTTPERPAVVEPGRQITYAELDVLSTRLAHHLRELGVGPDVPVGVALERGIDAVAAILGVLKAGGAYVPLDPTYPPERLRYVLADSGSRVLVTTGQLVKLFADDLAIPVVEVDPEVLARRPATPFDPGVTPKNLVYLMYTSGSTGKPKGVRTLHRNLNWYLDWFLDTVPHEAFAAVFGTIAFSFDVSAMDIWPPLLTGGQVRLSDGLLAVPADAPELRGVTMMNLVPSVLAEYLRANRLPDTVQTVTVGGEQLNPQLLADLFERSQVRDVHHLYGPTETTVFVTAQHVVRGDGQRVTLGRAIHSSRIDILDEHGARVPVGVPGEIYIGGPGVADGYLNRPELTAERFVPNPFAPEPGALMYRSGDIGRWNFDGEIEFLGRKDAQIKIRGVRIELGEIETTLHGHRDVASAVVSVHGGQELVAHVVPGSPDLDLDLLRAFAQEALPSFLVPSVFQVIDAIPLSPTGKVDRSALPAPASTVTTGEDTPRTPTEHRLAEIWEAVLGRSLIGPNAHFFQSGGHSLLAIRTAREIQTVFGVKLGIRTLFQTPVLADLAALLDRKLEVA